MKEDHSNKFFGLMIGMAVVVLFLGVVSLAPQVSEKFGQLSVKKQSQESQAALPPDGNLGCPLTAGRLYKGSSSSSVYIATSDCQKHGIVSAAVFEACGFAWNSVITITQSTLDGVTRGYDVTGGSCAGYFQFSAICNIYSTGFYAPGNLIKSSNYPTNIYIIDKNCVKHRLGSDADFLACGFQAGDVRQTYQEVIDRFTLGYLTYSPGCEGFAKPVCPGMINIANLYQPIENNSIYVIDSNCQKRGIQSMTEFNACLYDYSKVNRVYQKVLDRLTTGSSINRYNCIPAPRVPLVNNASCLSVTAPDKVLAGSVFSASLKVRNTGNTNWFSSSHKLGSQNPQDNTRWGTKRVSLPLSLVQPSEYVTFILNNFLSPQTPGTYPFDWRMLEEGKEWFGQTCTKSILVQSPIQFYGPRNWPAIGTIGAQTGGSPYHYTSAFKNWPAIDILDYRSASGTKITTDRKVYATISGKVEQLFYNDECGWGLDISYNGQKAVHYCHLSSDGLWPNGKDVTAGTQIGQMATCIDGDYCGNSTAIHVHYAMSPDLATSDLKMIVPYVPALPTVNFIIDALPDTNSAYNP